MNTTNFHYEYHEFFLEGMFYRTKKMLQIMKTLYAAYLETMKVKHQPNETTTTRSSILLFLSYTDLQGYYYVYKK